MARPVQLLTSDQLLFTRLIASAPDYEILPAPEARRAAEQRARTTVKVNVRFNKVVDIGFIELGVSWLLNSLCYIAFCSGVAILWG